jgi:hypothetical protein
MKEQLSLREALKEISVVVPGYGIFTVKSRIDKGDIPLIFQSVRKDNKSSLEVFVEENKAQPLSSKERKTCKDADYLLKASIFTAYQSLTSSFIVYQIAQNLF